MIDGADARAVSVTFAFATIEGNVGVVLPSQLVVSSHAHENSTPVSISQIKVAFDGGLRGFNIHNESTEKPESRTSSGLVHLHRVPLQKASSDPTSILQDSNVSQGSHLLVGVADLKIAPGVTKALSLDHIPRDSGDVEVASITLCMSEVDFDMELIITEQKQMHQECLWVEGPSGLLSKKAKAGRSSVVKILPKPPRMQIEAYGVAPIYFTDQDIAIEIEITNEEEEDTNVNIEARLSAPSEMIPTLGWALDDENEARDSAMEDPLNSRSADSPSKALGNLAPMANQKHTLCIRGSVIAAKYVLEIKARYYISSDPETPIIKTFSMNFAIVVPFEGNHGFMPMVHSEPWPSYFDNDDLDTKPNDDTGGQKVARGLTQRWSLTSRIASVASVPLIIESIEAQVVEIHEGTICSISSTSDAPVAASMISPNDLQTHNFIISGQKLDLEDRRSSFLDLRLEIKWHQDGFQGPPSFTYLSVPELIIPFGEPRVLASAQNGDNPPGGIYLDYFIENPSVYALPFLLTMDISEDFAFSGPKSVTVLLVPLSRYTVRYFIYPFAKGLWISPHLRVFDTHFQKSLKVNATQGMRSDKKGVSIWVDADS